MESWIFAACLIASGAVFGIYMVERVEYSAAFERGYSDGMEAANTIIAGVATK